jgi:hypothetical protein
MPDVQHASSAAPRETFGAQVPLALLGLTAIAIIALINVNATPAPLDSPQILASACGDCGTVVAVHQSAHASPVYYVEIRMLDGTHRVVQQLAAGFKAGDVVQVNGNALALRPQSS